MSKKVGWLALGLICAQPALAEEPFLVLQWPGTEVRYDSAKLQKTASKAVAGELSFQSADALGEWWDGDKRKLRTELLNVLMGQPEICTPVLKVWQLDVMTRFAESKGAFWLAIPVDGNAKKMLVWHWQSADITALTLHNGSCEV